MNKILASTLIVAALFATPAANAQSWSVSVGDGGGRYYPPADYDRGDGLVRTVCSGQRAYNQEKRLRHEEDEEEIDWRDARRIHAEIDRLEDKQRHECGEGDWRAVRGISYRYDRVAQWIDQEAHGDERRGW